MESFEVSTVLAATPARVYAAWLDSEELGACTGGQARVEPRAGGKFSLRDGSVQGHILDMRPSRQIVQLWRTPDMPCCCADSLVALLFEPQDRGATRLTIEHTGVPDALAARFRLAWLNDYLDCLRRYFAEA